MNEIHIYLHNVRDVEERLAFWREELQDRPFTVVMGYITYLALTHQPLPYRYESEDSDNIVFSGEEGSFPEEIDLGGGSRMVVLPPHPDYSVEGIGAKRAWSHENSSTQWFVAIDGNCGKGYRRDLSSGKTLNRDLRKTEKRVLWKDIIAELEKLITPDRVQIGLETNTAMSTKVGESLALDKFYLVNTDSFPYNPKHAVWGEDFAWQLENQDRGFFKDGTFMIYSENLPPATDYLLDNYQFENNSQVIYRDYFELLHIFSEYEEEVFREENGMAEIGIPLLNGSLKNISWKGRSVLGEQSFSAETLIVCNWRKCNYPVTYHIGKTNYSKYGYHWMRLLFLYFVLQVPQNLEEEIWDMRSQEAVSKFEYFRDVLSPADAFFIQERNREVQQAVRTALKETRRRR